MLVLYAVTEAGQEPPAPLGVCEGRRAAVLYAERPGRPTYARDDVVEFARTLLDLDVSRPVLPMRYGTTLEGLAALRALLEAKEESWLSQLRRLHDHVEVIVHWQFPTTPPTEQRSGRSFLLERVAHARRSRELAEELSRCLPGMVTETRLLKGDPARVACLVPRSALAAFHESLSCWAQSRDGLLTTTGPWPPFSFTETPGEWRP